jgi:rifampicin phosphotransferase
MVTTSPLTTSLVQELQDLRSPDPALVGTKAATLARLADAGHRIPEAFVLTTAAFRRLVATLDEPSPAALATTSLPAGVEEALLQISSRLGDGPLAVRSSATAEDEVDASYAGQYETVLGVRGAEQLVAAVRRCWASAFSDHAGAYRADQGDRPIAMAVLVQRQIQPRAAGVAFSADPVTGDRGVVVVNAVSGLGDAMAAGTVTPDEWRVSADGPRPVSGSDGALTAEDAAEVARLARAVEAEIGSPQDIEWAFDASGLWLLQARPITALPDEPIDPIPVPADPPDGYWERDASHFPAPASPLARTTVYPLANSESPMLFRQFGMLGERLDLMDIGGWHYVRAVPIGGKDRKPPPAPILALMVRLHPAMRRRARAARDVVKSGKGSAIIDRWWNDWQSALQARVDTLLATELSSLSDVELATHYGRCVDLMRDGIRSHVQVLGAVMVEIHPLLAACRDLLGWDAAEALDLVTGLSFRSTEPARELWRLAQRFHDNPAAMRELERIDQGSPGRLAVVDPSLAAEFETYRWSYGARGLSRDPADPTIADRPDLLLRMIASQLDSAFDPEAADRENEARRTAARERAGEVLARVSAVGRTRFEDALARAERAYPLREDNVFVALQAPVGLVRYSAMEVGQRLVQRGQIEAVDDVFFLEYSEGRDALADGSAPRSALVRRRKGERAWALAHPGPATYGTPPGPPPSMSVLPADLREVTESFLDVMALSIDPGTAAQSADGIGGVAGSPGRYTGPVRVVMDESQFHKIRAGDVVVCPATQPTWSVVFPVMGAIVTDSGGILSHSAIIAREYRIPAVVATHNGTSRLQDDQLVAVDGSTGVVEFVRTDDR